jgi:hypothetical protein
MLFKNGHLLQIKRIGLIKRRAMGNFWLYKGQQKSALVMWNRELDLSPSENASIDDKVEG